MKEVITIPASIRTERLVLMKNSLRDGSGVNAGKPLPRVFIDAINRDRQRLREYLPWVDLTQTEKDQEAYLSRCEVAWREFEMFDFGIFLPSGELVGNCGIHTVSRSCLRGEIGYWILGTYEGQGYVTEAIRGLCQTMFSAGFHRLEIRCNAENAKSYRVAERLGFQLEGTLREDCIENDEWRSTRIYGALATDAVFATSK